MVTKVEGFLRTFYILFLTFTNIFLFLIIPGWLMSPTFLASENQWNNNLFGFGVLFLFLIATFSITVSYFLFFRHLKAPDDNPKILHSSAVFTTLAWICHHIIMMLIFNATNETFKNLGYGVILFLLGYFTCTVAFLISYFLLKMDSKKRKFRRRMLQLNSCPNIISSNILMFPNQQISVNEKSDVIQIEAPELPAKVPLSD
uniref:MARVEL domain-containing protein n=1 Tax=Panagrolaimus sp. PS1159 TaxID=55785 RepID=A0AC35F1T4_9BILA